MKTIKRFYLDFDLTLDFLKNNLEKTNTLSSRLLKFVNFKSGNFYSFLPNHVEINEIHAFHRGGIAKGVRDFIIPFIMHTLLMDNRLACLFDDITSTYREDSMDELFLSNGLFYKNEVYYFISNEKATSNLINDCLCASDSIWHSLCIFFPLKNNTILTKEISLQKIDNICLDARLILLEAYDGEGYIFWDRNTSLDELKSNKG